MTDLDKALEYFKETTPDIREHLDTLKSLSSECMSVTEFGFRIGASFCALLAGLKDRPGTTLKTYDIHIPPQCVDFFSPLRGQTDLEYNQISTLDAGLIDPTELLFIDTLHNGDHLAAELERHASRVSKYLVFHDSTTFSRVGENGKAPGLRDAIEDFLVKNPKWQVYFDHEWNNGLMALRKGD